jgi:type II secretory pathway component PulC
MLKTLILRSKTFVFPKMMALLVLVLLIPESLTLIKLLVVVFALMLFYHSIASEKQFSCGFLVK